MFLCQSPFLCFPTGFSVSLSLSLPSYITMKILADILHIADTPGVLLAEPLYSISCFWCVSYGEVSSSSNQEQLLHNQGADEMLFIFCVIKTTNHKTTLFGTVIQRLVDPPRIEVRTSVVFTNVRGRKQCRAETLRAPQQTHTNRKDGPCCTRSSFDTQDSPP